MKYELMAIVGEMMAKLEKLGKSQEELDYLHALLMKSLGLEEVSDVELMTLFAKSQGK